MTDPIYRHRRRMRWLPDRRTMVQRRDTRALPDLPDDEDDEPTVKSAAYRRRWLGDDEDDRTEREIRQAIAAGKWPSYVDSSGEFVEARPVTEADLLRWANLVSRRQSRLDAVILRDRLVGWFDLPDTEYREPLDLLADVITILDEVIVNKGGREPEPGE